MAIAWQLFARFTVGFSFCLALSSSAVAQQIFEYEAVGVDNRAVPQLVLTLAHAPEVQAEIGVNSTNVDRFESGLRAIDRVWWPARLLAVEEQRTIVHELEGKLAELVRQVIHPKSLSRLRQLELQAQAIRVLARPDIQQFLKLDKQQISKLTELFASTDKLANSIDALKQDESKQAELQESRKAEKTSCLALLSSEQSQRLKTVLGKQFDTAKLERLYPLAPEFIEAEKQLGEGRSNWHELKGKVVLVHFYAFECHNCHANYPHYKRWNEKLKTKGVEVIGIQTPETANESVPENIVRAAKKEGFQFPVILDLDHQNWKAWGNTMWPTVYVVDKRGYVRFWWQGELNYQGAKGDEKIEQLVEKLLSEKS